MTYPMLLLERHEYDYDATSWIDICTPWMKGEISSPCRCLLLTVIFSTILPLKIQKTSMYAYLYDRKWLFEIMYAKAVFMYLL
jgi:hypothetical protein